jgi:adenylate cyclase class 2
MNQEFETQVLDIDKEEIITILRKLGAKEEPEVLQRRWIFDITPCTVASTGEWIRLRKVGDKKPTITYKNKSGKGMGDTQELEIEVEDFHKAEMLLSKLKFAGKYYQENKRAIFELNDIEFTLDSWPKIPTYLEIEAKSEEKVHEGLKMLGLFGKDVGHMGTLTIYKHYGIDLHSIKELTF